MMPICEGVMPFLANLQIMSCTSAEVVLHHLSGDKSGRKGGKGNDAPQHKAKGRRHLKQTYDGGDLLYGMAEDDLPILRNV